MKATEQYIPVVLFTMLYKVVPTFWFAKVWSFKWKLLSLRSTFFVVLSFILSLMRLQGLSHFLLRMYLRTCVVSFLQWWVPAKISNWNCPPDDLSHWLISTFVRAMSIVVIPLGEKHKKEKHKQNHREKSYINFTRTGVRSPALRDSYIPGQAPSPPSPNLLPRVLHKLPGNSTFFQYFHFFEFWQLETTFAFDSNTLFLRIPELKI